MTDKTATGEALPRRVKTKKQPAADTRSEAEKEIDSAISRSKIQGEKNKARKKNFSRSLMGIGALFLIYGIYVLFRPFQGTMAYGICKTYLELSVRYPNTLYVSTVENFAASVRMWYVSIDSFGEYRLESIQCYYKPDPTKTVPYVLEKIAVNRRDVDQQKVDDFNRVIPILFANRPDLTLPGGLADSLSDLKIDTNRFRKPIL